MWAFALCRTCNNADYRTFRRILLEHCRVSLLGRSLSHLAQLIDEFSAHKVALVVPAQGIDTSEGNPAGELQLHILCAVAEFEREIIRERVNAGLAAAKKKGVSVWPPRDIGCAP